MTNAPPPPRSRTPLNKRLERTAGRLAMFLLVRPLRTMPFPAARRVGILLGSVLFTILGRYRRVALKNLALVYPDTPASERKRIAQAVFRHFGEMGAEFLKLPQLDRAAVDALATVEGEQHLIDALDGRRGGFIITGHFGNWEFLARWLTTHGYKLNVVARDARDPKATKLMADVRQGSGAQVLYRGSSARAVLQSLKRNELVALLPDQNAADVFVPFLGLPTGTVDGPAVLHLKTGAPLVFSWCRRTADDRFHITFEPAETVESTGDRTADVARIMTMVNARLDRQIRRYPGQWLWLHDRWKASPELFGDAPRTVPDLPAVEISPTREAEESHDAARR